MEEKFAHQLLDKSGSPNTITNGVSKDLTSSIHLINGLTGCPMTDSIITTK